MNTELAFKKILCTILNTEI